MFKLEIDASEISAMADRLIPAAEKAMQEAAEQFVPMVHAHMVEEANARLHSRRQPYLDALSYHQESEDTWLIVLDASAVWIEDGLPPHSMVDDLLNGSGGKSTKTDSEGNRYRVIPFKHGTGIGPATMTPTAVELQSTIKKAFKNAHNSITNQKGIPWAKIETGSDGKPLIGKIHSIDIMNNPKKTAHGPGQGWGNIGDPKVGATGIPFLQGVSVYQDIVGGRAQRSIMTFRTVSEKHKEEGRWFHPGLEPVNIFDDAEEWALQEWENVIVPNVMRTVMDSI